MAERTLLEVERSALRERVALETGKVSISVHSFLSRGTASILLAHTASPSAAAPLPFYLVFKKF